MLAAVRERGRTLLEDGAGWRRWWRGGAHAGESLVGAGGALWASSKAQRVGEGAEDLLAAR